MMTLGDAVPLPTAIWLTAEPVRSPVDSLLQDMLAPNLPGVFPREAEMEELRRGVKLADVAIEYLGLRTVGVDAVDEMPLRIVAPKGPADPWREGLLVPGSDRPVGLLINTADLGPVVLIHEVFHRFSQPEKNLIRRYAALALRGEPHRHIIALLEADPTFGKTL